MGLKLLVKPVDVESLKINLKPDSIYHSLYVFEDKLPRWKNLDIAIIGVEEYRGQNFEVMTSGTDKFRKRFYELKQQKHSLKVVDLGNIINGETYEDTLERLTEVCKLLMEEKVIPFIIGGSHDLDIGQFKAYEHLNKDLKVLTVDSSIDIAENGEEHESHIRKMLIHEPNFLFNYSHLGYQTYLNHPNATDLLEKMNCDHVRLGEISSDITKTEPTIRFANMISFDLSAIKQSDFNTSFNPQPFGLTAENACQMMWYVGLSNNCNSTGIYGYYPELDGRGNGSGVIAIMAWYFVEGFYHRKKVNFKSKDFKKFNVEVDDENLIFYKDVRNEMWWVEVEDGKNIEIVPCSYAHYHEATLGTLPQLVFDMRMKFV